MGGALASASGDGSDDADIGERVHDIRKRIKKLRGLIRLVRPAFPDFEAEDVRLRDIARAISGVRDAEVVAATLDRLIETHAEPLTPKAFDDLRAELAGEKVHAPDLAPIIDALEQARARIDLWTLHETGWDAVSGGLRITYKQARKRRKARGDDGLHAWRKPVKYHWYHIRLLHEIWPEEMEARETAADTLGDRLGLRQDLAVLDQRIKRSSLSKETRRVLRGLIDQRKSEIEAEARDIVPLLFADKPKALATSWGERWEAWRA